MLTDLATTAENSATGHRPRLPPWRTVAMTLLLGVAAALLLSMIWEPLRAPWEFDESYNLQVVENLRDGNGYSTHGAVRGDGPWEFDPNISTGPAVLLPVWLLSLPLGTLAGARVTMFAFLAALLILMRLLTGPGRTGWFVFALALLACLPFLDAANPLLVLGEIPATAMLLGALVAMRRESYWVMGLLIGLVGLTKLNYATAAVAVTVVWIGSTLLTEPRSWRTLVRQVGRVTAGAIAPILAFELYRVVSLGGLSAYRSNLAGLRSFLDAQRLDHWTEAPGLLGDKVVAVIAIPGPFLLVALTVCALVAPFVGRALVTIGSDGEHATDVDTTDGDVFQTDDIASVRTEVAIAAAGASIVATWLFLSGVPWLRQGAPGAMLISFAVISMFSRRTIPTIRQSNPSVRVPAAVVLSAVAGLLCVAGVVATVRNVDRVNNSAFEQAEREQDDVANLIRTSGATGILTDGWFQNPQLQLLSGVPASSMPGADVRPLVVVDALKFIFTDDSTGLDGEAERCDRVLYRSDAYLVCWPLERDDTGE